jgi:thiamine biosynthesis lipoprotein
MDTVVTIELSEPDEDATGLVNGAYRWFEEVERACSRFDPGSELRRLLATAGHPQPVSPLLFQAIDFALQVAEATGGVFDPTIGARMEAAGYATDYRSGRSTATGLDPAGTGSIKDIVLDPKEVTILLRRPVLLDLGAVAKGFAIDLAARELGGRGGFAISAGGDIFVSGSNPDGEPWRIGVRHPRRPDELLCVLALTDAAVCTSGDYERGGHILASGRESPEMASLTAIGPSAMVADALSTAAFLMGPKQGLALLEAQGVDGLAVDSGLAVHQSAGFARHLM